MYSSLFDSTGTMGSPDIAFVNDVAAPPERLRGARYRICREAKC